LTGPAAETALERKEKRAVKKPELLAPAGNLEERTPFIWPAGNTAFVPMRTIFPWRR